MQTFNASFELKKKKVKIWYEGQPNKKQQLIEI